MTAANRSRWQRLAAEVSSAGNPVSVSERMYPGGTSFSLVIRLLSGQRVEVHDKWWRKNPDVWIGYQVHIETADSIVRRAWPITKKRSEVVAAVREAASLEAVA